MREELGIKKMRLKHLYDYMMSNRIETESIRTYLGIYNGPFKFNPDEIDEVKFWSKSEIRKNLGRKIFTPNFEDEFGMFTNYMINP